MTKPHVLPTVRGEYLQQGATLLNDAVIELQDLLNEDSIDFAIVASIIIKLLDGLRWLALAGAQITPKRK